jgi:hypothetical protein
MFRPLFQPLRHLPLDDARVDAVAPDVDPLLPHLPQEVLVPLVERLCRCAEALRQATLQDAKTADERQTVHIPLLRPSRLEHQRSHHEVRQRQRIQLLAAALGSLASQLGRLFRAVAILVAVITRRINLRQVRVVRQASQRLQGREAVRRRRRRSRSAPLSARRPPSPPRPFTVPPLRQSPSARR